MLDEFGSSQISGQDWGFNPSLKICQQEWFDPWAHFPPCCMPASCADLDYTDAQDAWRPPGKVWACWRQPWDNYLGACVTFCARRFGHPLSSDAFFSNDCTTITMEWNIRKWQSSLSGPVKAPFNKRLWMGWLESSSGAQARCGDCSIDLIATRWGTKRRINQQESAGIQGLQGKAFSQYVVWLPACSYYDSVMPNHCY